MKIKALSVRQPWANLIASGKKTIETRTWNTNYRGYVLIVSSKKPKIEPAGKALVLAKIVDSRPMTKEDEDEACCKLYPRAWSWVLSDVKKIKPFSVKGKLGLYDVDVEGYCVL